MVKKKPAAKPKAKAKVKTKTTKAKSRPVAKKPSSKAVAKNSTKKTTKAKVAKPVKSTKTSQSLKVAKPLKTAKKPTPGLGEGALAPSFSMPSTITGTVSSSDLQGKPYLVYFYPKDDTSGCTAQACGFRDAVPDLGKLGLTVIGVSKDSIKSHEKFAGKYNLTFPLASDEKTKVSEAFGTWVQKSMYGRSYMGIERSTFLVDGNGKIRAVWRKVNVPGHVEDVKKAVEKL